MKLLAALVVSLALSGSACAKPPLEAAMASRVQLISSVDGRVLCGGVAVGDHTILTAEHCIDGEPFTVEGQVTRGIVLDGRDHALIQVEKPLKARPAKLAPLPKLLDKVVEVGMPRGYGPLAREGTYSGTVKAPDGSAWHVFSIRVAPGDSGSGIYDSKGRIITLVSIGFMGNQMSPDAMAAGQALGFTKEQWSKAE